MLYQFASLRGPDFEIEGNSPEGAWNNLCEREKDNGNLWKTGDFHRNKAAVNFQGFSYLRTGNRSVAYKEITLEKKRKNGKISLLG